MTQSKFITGQWSEANQYIPGEEIRIKDPVSGGEKGQKLEAFALIPSQAMEEVARVYGRGAEKYAARNWEKGYDWDLSISALERHIAKFKQGESQDELGNHHLACVVFHCLALITFERFGLGTDTRSKLRATQTTSPAPVRPEVPWVGPASNTWAVGGSGGLVDNSERIQEVQNNQFPDYNAMDWYGGKSKENK